MITALKKAREEAGISQTRLAALTGLAQSMISDAERGQLMPYPRARRKLAKALGKSESELFPYKFLPCYGGDDEPDKS
ncbi:MAG: helix-turn-helix domain-containing protein [Candidatus Geothermincolia bacterium]